jgi:hypothetical protein
MARSTAAISVLPFFLILASCKDELSGDKGLDAESSADVAVVDSSIPQTGDSDTDLKIFPTETSTIDGGVLDAGTVVLSRLLVVVQEFGMFSEAAELPNAPMTSDAWRRDLSTDVASLPLVLQPFATQISRVTMLADLGLHVGINQDSNNPTMLLTGHPPWRPLGTKTGDPIRSPAPSVDWLVGAANASTSHPGALVIGTSRTSTFDGDGHLVKSIDLSQIAASLRSAACPVTRKPESSTSGLGDWMAAAIPLVVDAFTCDQARVVTMNLPRPSSGEISYVGDLEQNYAQQIHVAGTVGESARKVMRQYNQFIAQQVANLATTLTRTETNGRPLLDSTLILWLGREGQPDHVTSPFYAVLITSNNAFVGARYVRPAQLNSGAPGVLGPAHNQLLTSVANLFGLHLAGVGPPVLTLQSGVKIQLAGSLPFQ